MKTYEELREEAEKVLESVGEVVKSKGGSLYSADEINAVASLADSYARLYEEIQK